MDKQPKTLQEAMIYFADKQNAHDFIVSLRWSDGVICPHCGGTVGNGFTIEVISHILKACLYRI